MEDRQQREKVSDMPRMKRKPYSSLEYPRGRGAILCELCGFPLKEHELDTHPQVARSGQA